MRVFFWIYIKQILKVSNKSAAIWIAAFFFFSMLVGNALAGDLTETIHAVSRRFRISEDLIWRVIRAESGFDERAVSRCDARGLMQITRPTWNWICRDYLEQDWSFDAAAFDPEKNIIVGTCFLRWICDYLERHQTELQGPRIHLVLACYNAGPGAVRRHCFTVPPFAETRRYVQRILTEPNVQPAVYTPVFTANPGR